LILLFVWLVATEHEDPTANQWRTRATDCPSDSRDEIPGPSRPKIDDTSWARHVPHIFGGAATRLPCGAGL